MQPLDLVEAATENAATVQALNRQPRRARAGPGGPTAVHHRRRKALSTVIRRTFGGAAAIQRRQIHKARNIME
jgi:putative transposase